jgi:hypothetical protein
MNDSTVKFLRPDGRELPPMHHLDRHPRGSFRLKVTVDKEGSRYSGTRIKVPLRTRDSAEAMARRDVAILALKQAGCICRNITVDEAGDNSETSSQ